MAGTVTSDDARETLRGGQDDSDIHVGGDVALTAAQ